MTHRRPRRFAGGLPIRAAAVLAAALGGGACTSPAPPPAAEAEVTPVYNPQTGKLEEIVSDRNKDGRLDTRAFMDGSRLIRIEIDRDADGEPDRWEFYATAPEAPQGTVIDRAEEAAAPGRPITRREFYEGGALVRVEEDTDLDGRVDKWERYGDGRLASLDLDPSGVGHPTRRFVYGPGGEVERVETDTNGDGVFEVPPPLP